MEKLSGRKREENDDGNIAISKEGGADHDGVNRAKEKAQLPELTESDLPPLGKV